MKRFVTITDVTAYLFDADPYFREDLTEEQMQAIVRRQTNSIYGDINAEELENMIIDAYCECGCTQSDAQAIVR